MANDMLLISFATLLGTAIIALTMLRGWTLWLKLKLRERIKVLERIATDDRKSISLAKEIEALRDK